MSVVHVSETKTDPKFVPPAAALKVVGLTVAQVKTDDALFDLITTNQGTIAHLDDQIAVAIYIFQQRGYTFEALIPKTGMAERTLKRKAVEGMAILRTKEVTRTVSAIRSGALSKKVVDEITASTAGPEEKVRLLEQAAVKEALKGYVAPDGKSADVDAKVDVLHTRLEAVVEDAVTAANLIAAIPALTEETGFKVKESTRSANSQDDNGPFGLEHHLKAALADMHKIAEAAGQPYVPTPQDVYALLQLAEYVGVGLDLDPDMAAAVSALVEA